MTEMLWQVGVALDTAANDAPIFVGKGTNIDPDGNLIDSGFCFDVMFHKNHPLAKRIGELEQIGKRIRIVVVPCKDEKHSLEVAKGLIYEYKLLKDGGTLLNLSEDGENEGRTYSGSPSKLLH